MKIACESRLMYCIFLSDQYYFLFLPLFEYAVSWGPCVMLVCIKPADKKVASYIGQIKYCLCVLATNEENKAAACYSVTILEDLRVQCHWVAINICECK